MTSHNLIEYLFIFAYGHYKFRAKIFVRMKATYVNSIQKNLEISFRVFCSPVFLKVDDQVFDVFKETFEQFLFRTIRWTAGGVSFTVALLNSEIRIIENVKIINFRYLCCGSQEW